jgi:DNA-binding NarL/FixJ family response regulator
MPELVTLMPITVLIVDDHPIVRKGLTNMLGQQPDIEVVGHAGDGVDAVAKARELVPDIILMDLKMPRMDGAEAITEIFASHLKTNVIVLTAYASDEEILNGIQAGARGYLLKNSSQEEMIDAIRTVHQGESVIQAPVAARLIDHLGRSSNFNLQSNVLSQREIEVLQLIATGAANKAIAAQLMICQSTVKTHIVRIFSKLSVNERTGAVGEGLKRGLIRL